MKDFWNKRYSNLEYAYGIEPNDFFAREIQNTPPGRILLFGEGEGRNAVYASKLGWNVDCVDYSESAKEKALALAEKNNVQFNYIIHDLTSYIPRRGYYDSIAIVFLHLVEEERQALHSNTIASLKPGGRLILEVFEKDQIKFDSGGPKNQELLYSLEDIYTDFNELEIEKFSKEKTILNEGPFHQGEAMVIRFVATKPH